mmetsp:Transcript_72494/g.170489  ORF Transcript_72494/g.170489 Transcript_72494/m.170489 type:complete len:226 (+) Transcript_72494:162-839(+)
MFRPRAVDASATYTSRTWRDWASLSSIERGPRQLDRTVLWWTSAATRGATSLNSSSPSSLVAKWDTRSRAMVFPNRFLRRASLESSSSWLTNAPHRTETSWHTPSKSWNLVPWWELEPGAVSSATSSLVNLSMEQPSDMPSVGCSSKALATEASRTVASPPTFKSKSPHRISLAEKILSSTSPLNAPSPCSRNGPVHRLPPTELPVPSNQTESGLSSSSRTPCVR